MQWFRFNIDTNVFHACWTRVACLEHLVFNSGEFVSSSQPVGDNEDADYQHNRHKNHDSNNDEGHDCLRDENDSSNLSVQSYFAARQSFSYEIVFKLAVSL